MAYVSNNQEEDEQNNGQSSAQGPVAPAGGNAVHLAPSSGVGSTGAPGASGAPAAGSGGSFATLDKYVGANQGQAEGLANNITKGIGDQYNTLNTGNQSTLSGLQGSVNSAYTPQDTGVLSAEAADPVSFASNPTNISSFQKQLTDQYTGPTSAEGDAGYQKQQSAINNAIQQGNASTQTEAGRAGLLHDTEKVPTTGVTALNSAILSQDPNAQAKIENAYQPFSNLLTGLSTGAQDINKSISGAQTQAQGATAAANKQIADQTAALNGGVNNELADAQKQYTDYQTAANGLGASLAAGKLPSGLAVDQGLLDFQNGQLAQWNTANAPGATFGYNFSNIIPQLPSANAPTLAQAATAKDYATFNALNNIVGSPIASPLNGLDAAQAGTYKAPSLSNIPVDSKAYAKDLEDSYNSGPALNVNQNAYSQFKNLMAALDKYRGLPGGPTGSTGATGYGPGVFNIA